MGTNMVSESKNLGRVVMWQMLNALKEGDFKQAMELIAPGYWQASREAIGDKKGQEAWDAILEPEVIICFASSILRASGILLVCREVFKRMFKDPRQLPAYEVRLITNAFQEETWPDSPRSQEELLKLLEDTAALSAFLTDGDGIPANTEDAVAKMRAAAITAFLGMIGSGEALDNRDAHAARMIGDYFAHLKMAHAASIGNWDQEGIRASAESDLALCDALRGVVKPSLFDAVNPDKLLKGQEVGQA